MKLFELYIIFFFQRILRDLGIIKVMITILGRSLSEIHLKILIRTLEDEIITDEPDINYFLINDPLAKNFFQSLLNFFPLSSNPIRFDDK